jgi:phosphatidate cytidylyltransferase
MSDLPKRLLTAIILGVLVIGSIYYSENTFCVLMIVISLIASHEYISLSTYGAEVSEPNIIKRAGAFISGIPLILYLFFKLSHTPYTFALLMLGILIGMMVLYSYQLFKNEIGDWRVYQSAAMATVYIGVPSLMIVWISSYPVAYDWMKPMSLLILIWANDVFAYFTGRLLGKRPLYAQISPKKTMEGFAGGLISTIITALILSVYVHQLSPIQWVIYGFTISIVSTVGDLFESMIKRRYGVKDSGTLLPGHGGFLDRFDAFLFSIPIAALFLYLCWK